MIQRWIGAGCVFLACSAAGFQAAASLSKEYQLITQTKRMLDKMESELSCRAVTLDQLCLAASDCGKTLVDIYHNLSQELQAQVFPDASACMDAVLCKYVLPASVKQLHRMLGQTFGKYDLDGQLEEIRAVKQVCLQELQRHQEESSQKTRSYQTLGLCAGAALAILLI